MIFVGEGTSINDLELSEVKVFPNPVENMLNVSSVEAFDRVIIKDISGRKVKSITNKGVSASINVEQLPEGVYFVNLMNENQLVGFSKVVK